MGLFGRASHSTSSLTTVILLTRSSFLKIETVSLIYSVSQISSSEQKKLVEVLSNSAEVDTQESLPLVKTFTEMISIMIS